MEYAVHGDTIRPSRAPLLDAKDDEDSKVESGVWRGWKRDGGTDARVSLKEEWSDGAEIGQFFQPLP